VYYLLLLFRVYSEDFKVHMNLLTYTMFSELNLSVLARSIIRLGQTVTYSAVLSVGVWSQCQASLEVIAPEAVHSRVLKSITQSLNFDHFKQIELNDSFSKIIFTHYLETLDPLKLHFSKIDIDELQKYELYFDDLIRAGNLDIPFKIFNLYHNRSEQRYTYMLSRLNDNEFLDFTTQETLIIDRESNPWPKDMKALHILWNKQLKEAALRLELTDKDEKEIRTLLKSRFEAKLNYLSQTNSEDVFQGFMNAVTELYDPHTQYLSPRASDNFNINMSLSLEGIGAVLQTEDEYTKVVRLVAGGPADQNGSIKPLDKIVAVGAKEDDLTNIIGWRIDEVVALIRGPKGTPVFLEVQSAQGKSPISKVIKITRNTVKLEDQAARSDILKLDRNGTKYKLGILEIPAFYADFSGRSKGNTNYRRVSDDVEKILKSTQMNDVDGLVIDLRSNGGGSLQEANRLIGLFLKTGPTVQIKNTREQISLNRDSDSKLVFDKPLVVLIDRLSASASEIFAGAIQDYQRGIVVGSRSFGKGTVQVLRTLDHGQLKMTHAKFYRISGASNQHQGIVPDIEMVSAYDPAQVGESALDNALPWDTIPPAQFKPYYQLKTIIPELYRLHQQRIKTNFDYTYLTKETKILQDMQNEKALILNKKQRQLEIAELEGKRLGLENERRQQKKLPLLKNYSDLESQESASKENAAKSIITPDDVILLESSEVLADMIDSYHNKMLSENKNTETGNNLFDFFEEILN